jgi:preprotein translocase subunit SecE
MSVAEQTSSAESRGITSWWQGSRSFLTEVRNEMRRVTWPSRREVQATTIVVILVAAFFGVYLYGVDMILSWLVRGIFRMFGAV